MYGHWTVGKTCKKNGHILYQIYEALTYIISRFDFVLTLVYRHKQVSFSWTNFRKVANLCVASEKCRLSPRTYFILYD